MGLVNFAGRFSAFMSSYIVFNLYSENSKFLPFLSFSIALFSCTINVLLFIKDTSNKALDSKVLILFSYLQVKMIDHKCYVFKKMKLVIKILK